jgi:hypothetical protein
MRLYPFMAGLFFIPRLPPAMHCAKMPTMRPIFFIFSVLFLFFISFDSDAKCFFLKAIQESYEMTLIVGADDPRHQGAMYAHHTTQTADYHARYQKLQNIYLNRERIQEEFQAMTERIIDQWRDYPLFKNEVDAQNYTKALGVELNNILLAGKQAVGERKVTQVKNAIDRGTLNLKSYQILQVPLFDDQGPIAELNPTK